MAMNDQSITSKVIILEPAFLNVGSVSRTTPHLYCTGTLTSWYMVDETFGFKAIVGIASLIESPKIFPPLC